MTRTRTLASLAFFAAVVSGVSSGVLAGCGSRGPLDIGDVYGAADASVADASALSDANALVDAPPPVDANALIDANPPVDAGFVFDSGVPLINCGVCVAQACGTDVVNCILATSCRTILQCAATTCLAGGTPSPTCLLGCGQSDPQSAVEVINLFECVLTSCGSDCTSALAGGLGGGDAGIGGGGRPMPDAGAGDQ